MASGWTCSQCNRESAERFCYCANSETFLCKSCQSTHNEKFPMRPHQNLPLGAYRHHRAPGYVDRLSARTQAVEAGTEALLLQLQSTDRCVEEITAKVNELYLRIRDAGQKALEEVQQAQAVLRETVQRSIEEAERTVYEDNPILAEVYSPSLRAFAGRLSFTLFQYEVKASDTVESVFKVNFKSTTELSQASKPPEEAREHPISRFSPPTAPAITWKCSCGFDGNQRSYACCVICKLPNPAAPRTPEERKVAPVVKPPTKLCVKCRKRAVGQGTDTCSSCFNENSWVCVYCRGCSNLVNERCRNCKRTQEEVYPEMQKAQADESQQKTNWKCRNCNIVLAPTLMNCSLCGKDKNA